MKGFKETEFGVVFSMAVSQGYEGSALRDRTVALRIVVRASAFVVDAVAPVERLCVLTTTDLGAGMVVHGVLLGGDCTVCGAAILGFLSRLFGFGVLDAVARPVDGVLSCMRAGTF